jgi:aromatic ring-opening dioxygenase catalytic subunit (LigB family)
MPVLGDPGHAGLTASLKRLPKDIGVPNPTAILVISAHWEVCPSIVYLDWLPM